MNYWNVSSSFEVLSDKEVCW